MKLLSFNDVNTVRQRALTLIKECCYMRAQNQLFYFYNSQYK